MQVWAFTNYLYYTSFFPAVKPFNLIVLIGLIFIVLAFGSIVKKTNIQKSDIDICIISDNKLKTQELISKLGLLPLKLEIQNFSVKEFESMLEKKQNNLASEIIKNNVILYGVENYYNLISKWMKKE